MNKQVIKFFFDSREPLEGYLKSWPKFPGDCFTLIDFQTPDLIIGVQTFSYFCLMPLPETNESGEDDAAS